jgi:capsule polysaccharide modification protein KpsS
MHVAKILNATAAFANITQMNSTGIRKDDQKHKELLFWNFFLTFPIILDQNKLDSIWSANLFRNLLKITEPYIWYTGTVHWIRIWKVFC